MQKTDADIVVDHMADCLGANAAIVVDGNADSLVADLLAHGWTIESRVDVILGKRIRIVHPPKAAPKDQP